MLNLKIGVTKNPRFEPLIDGSVKSDRANLNIHVTTPPELFYKNLKNDEFDVFEMSLSEFLITREQAKGDRWRWTALPIFPAKAFVWMTLFVNTAAGIQGLCDLKGKRVGIPDYVMTAGLWFRVILHELCGIQPKDISWYIGRVVDLSHGGLLGVDTRPPAGVSTTWLTKEQTFDIMLDKGEIDAAYGFAPRHDPKLMTLNIDRYGGTPLEGNPRLRKMFADGGLSIVEQFYQKPASCRPIMSSSPNAACSRKTIGWQRKSSACSAKASASPTNAATTGIRPISISNIAIACAKKKWSAPIPSPSASPPTAQCWKRFFATRTNKD